MANHIHHLNDVCLHLCSRVCVCEQAQTASQGARSYQARSVLFAELNQGLLACLTLAWIWEVTFSVMLILGGLP